MKLNEIKYSKRFNNGNYEHEEFSISAYVEDDETAAEVFETLKKEVRNSKSGGPVKVAESTEVEQEEEPEEETPEEEEEETPEQDEEDSEFEDVEDEDLEDVEEESDEGENDEDDDAFAEVSKSKKKETRKTSKKKTTGSKKSTKKVAKKASSKKASAKKSFKSKNVPYDRSQKPHREILSKLLDECRPDWRDQDSLKQRGKQLSMDLTGKDFLDSNGEVLKSFETIISKKMWMDK